MTHEKTLFARLEEYSRSDMLPMHMPGHKRACIAPYLSGLSAALDITEVEGFDNLHAPTGLLMEAQANAAACWGATESYFLVGGSSAGILSGIYAAARRGDEILLGRNAHKSVFHAIELCGLVPRLLTPPFIPGTEIFASMPPETVKAAIAAHPDARLLVLTSPTYEGVLSDIETIAGICHEHGLTLMVDEAHGAHLGLGGSFPKGAVACGADLVVQSLHKTLPSLTQTAILHRCGCRVSPERLRHALAVFQTSSPSYLLMASIDGCVTLLRESPDLLPTWRENLRRFSEETAALRNIRVLFSGTLPPSVFDHDPSKLVLTANCSGHALGSALRDRFHIEPEMTAPGYALAMTGAGDSAESLARLARGLSELDASLPQVPPAPFAASLPPAELVMEPGLAMQSPVRFSPPADAVGQVSGEYVWAYPPGIPLLLPGERISRELAGLLANKTARLHSTYSRIPSEIAVVRQKTPAEFPFRA